MAPPLVAGEKISILERHRWKVIDFAVHAKVIRSLTEKYTVDYIGVDAIGVDQSVYQLVRSFFSAAHVIRYMPEMRTAIAYHSSC